MRIKLFAIIIGLTSIFFLNKCESISFDPDTSLTDIDGNVYQTVVIGDQEWMAENLKVTHYSNGDPIITGQSSSTWVNLSTCAYAVYDNDESNADTYGYLYNWYAVYDSRNIAPKGWHVATDTEWKTLEIELGMSQSGADNTGNRGTNQGSQLAGNVNLWEYGSLINNFEFGKSGFTALPGGYRNSNGNYGNMGFNGNFWSSTEYNSTNAWYREINYDSSEFFNQNGAFRYSRDKKYGLSVRCVKD